PIKIQFPVADLTLLPPPPPFDHKSNPELKVQVSAALQ
ncbi:hypothetical protein C5167_036648, partial [Papaver somniferum]